MIDIRKLASEAKLGGVLSHDGGESRVWIEGADWHDELERFAALVLEDAAKVCDEISIEAAKQWKERYRPFDQGREHGADECAEAIRALKPKGEV